ncbi:hypothetical protein [Gracilibacillus salinarum]|uniref:DUF2975 domain-containing protein n=1 Tax=Gracilibacillus salinarum TaxID=2932255 RepID=A0ABY4GHS4_9BACI|nr:hypothetical protein [Gracilibacillus salinarum]UOQ83540.1 hypothetical protein MUN87_12305 [Gracilibacillus salinarum]
MFQPKALFESGLKIIGVLTIIWSFTQITPVVFQFFSVYNQPDMMSNNNLSYYRFSLIFRVVYPIILFIIGMYLLKGGKAIVELAFREMYPKNEDKMGWLFFLFMKMAGLVLVIYALPKAFQLISNIMFTSSVNAIDTSEQTKFIVQNLVTTVINLVLGFYLLTSGKLFYKLGFSNTNDVE